LPSYEAHPDEPVQGTRHRGGRAAEASADLGDPVRAASDGVEDGPELQSGRDVLEEHTIRLAVEGTQAVEHQAVHLRQDTATHFAGELPVAGNSAPCGVQLDQLAAGSRRESFRQEPGVERTQIEDLAGAAEERRAARE